MAWLIKIIKHRWKSDLQLCVNISDIFLQYCSICLLFHDIFIVVAIFSILQLEVDSTFIAALLTIFGYSINDKIVVFDRIRENMGRVKKDQLSGIVDLSIAQSFTRSMNTSISTRRSYCIYFSIY